MSITIWRENAHAYVTELWLKHGPKPKVRAPKPPIPQSPQVQVLTHVNYKGTEYLFREFAALAPNVSPASLKRWLKAGLTPQQALDKARASAHGATLTYNGVDWTVNKFATTFLPHRSRNAVLKWHKAGLTPEQMIERGLAPRAGSRF
jgi:hypothetical protein